jgi:S1-C subfamily serine protease
MLRRILTLSVAVFLTAGFAFSRAPDEKKTDLQTPVAEGKEVALTPVEITVSDTVDKTGRHTATVKPAKESKKVVMPARAWGLGFVAEPVKGGVKVVAVPSGSSAMRALRTTPGRAGEGGEWQADPGDIITHVGDYAVNSVEELVCAVSVAKDKADVRIVLKDGESGALLVFYITATRQ